MFEIRLRPEHGLAIATFTGDLRASDVMAALLACYDADGWRPGMDIVWDYRAVGKVLFEPDDMRRIVDVGLAHQAVGGAGRDINLVRRDKAMHELMSRAFLAYRQYRKGTLRTPLMAGTPTEAAALLGVPPEALLEA